MADMLGRLIAVQMASKNNQPVDGFGRLSGDSQQGLRQSEILLTLLTVLAISLVFAVGVAAAAEWLRPERLFPGRIEIPHCVRLAAGLAG